MEIRTAGTPADRDAAVEVWRACRAAEGRRPSTAVLAEMTEQAQDLVLLLAGEAGEAVGAAVGHVEDELLRVAAVVVRPEHRGAGAGTALLEGLADLAWERGARRATAQPHDFYTACGFEPAGDALAAELEAPVRDVEVQGEIRLGQFLKRAELVDTGAEAKSLIADGAVLVNDEVEERRGRQLADGDVVRAPSGAARVLLS